MIDETHEKIGDLVAAIYRKVEWKKMTSMKRSAVDVLAARIRAASSMPSVPAFIEKLCHGLHIQGVNADPDLIDALDQSRKESMKILREEAVYVALLAQKKAKAKKDEKQKELTEHEN